MHELPKLDYQYNALEPFIDAQTMEVHHTKHHTAYIEKLNTALEKYPELQSKTIDDLLKNLTNLPADLQPAVQNNGGGHYNHTLFWKIMSPNASHAPQGDLKAKIEATYETLDIFIDQFSVAGLSRFGSGWVWLVKTPENTLKIYSTANQDCPLTLGDTPLIGLDVWEHAYYLKYQNRRAEYIKNWWNVLDWKAIEANFTA